MYIANECRVNREFSGGLQTFTHRSKSHEIGPNLAVVVLGGPEVKGCGGDFVHQRNGVAVERKVDRLEVAVAGVAGFDANRGCVVGSVARKLLVAGFSADRAKDTAELPFRMAQR